ncbi:MAG: ParB/RepB/Spo0J family partition protein [Thiohalospira sp.]
MGATGLLQLRLQLGDAALDQAHVLEPPARLQLPIQAPQLLARLLHRGVEAVALLFGLLQPGALQQVRASLRHPRAGIVHLRVALAQAAPVRLPLPQVGGPSGRLLQPLVVRRIESGYELVAGERRLRAIRELGWERAPAVLRDLSDEAMLVLALVENLQRENLNPIEEATAFQQLIDGFGFTQTQVAERLDLAREGLAQRDQFLAELLLLVESNRVVVLLGQREYHVIGTRDAHGHGGFAEAHRVLLLIGDDVLDLVRRQMPRLGNDGADGPLAAALAGVHSISLDVLHGGKRLMDFSSMRPSRRTPTAGDSAPWTGAWAGCCWPASCR